MDTEGKGLSDIAVRAGLNASHKHVREPVDVRAERYIAENPQVYHTFCQFTFEVLRTGREHVGAQMVAERMRWESMVSGNDGFKVNNSYIKYLAEKFHKDYPLYGKVFRTRASPNGGTLGEDGDLSGHSD